MAITAEEKKNLMQRAIDFIANLGKEKPALNNLVLETGKGPTFYEGDLQVGTALFADEAMTTPVGPGVWETEAGKVTTDESGKVTLIEAIATAQPDAAALQAKVTDLETQLANIKAEKEAADKLANEAEAAKVAAEAKAKEVQTNLENSAEIIKGLQEIVNSANHDLKDKIENKDDKSLTEGQKLLRDARERAAMKVRF